MILTIVAEESSARYAVDSNGRWYVSWCFRKWLPARPRPDLLNSSPKAAFPRNQATPPDANQPPNGAQPRHRGDS